MLSLPLAKLSQQAPSELDPAQAVVTVCDSAYGASLAVGLLERLGFKKVGCLDGGRDTWAEAGLTAGRAAVQPAKTPAATAPHHLPKRVVRLPQRISPADLKRSLEDLPETFDLVDIRPAKAFEEFKLPGSINVDVAEVMQNPLYLRGTGPLILVDRDGSLAMAVGGVLSQKTWRPIKVLHGGLEAYAREFGVKLPGETPAKPEPREGISCSRGGGWQIGGIKAGAEIRGFAEKQPVPSAGVKIADKYLAQEMRLLMSASMDSDRAIPPLTGSWTD